MLDDDGLYDRRMFEPVHRGLTADMFVVRGSGFLTLTRAAGSRGEGLQYLPGGGVDRGEDPEVAAIRETFEESGLVVRDVTLLRVWTYATPEGWDTVHATYIGHSDSGDPKLSDEHTAFQWTTPQRYINRWCSPAMEAAVPAFASWFSACRRNCELLLDLMAD